MFTFKKSIKIGNFVISNNSKSFVIAEAGVNHNGNMEMAKKLIDIAVRAKANAVKFQAFATEELILKNIKKAPYQLKSSDSNESQFEMLKKLELSKEKLLLLKRHCDRRKIIFLITPFDEYSLSYLDEFDLAAYKISSTDSTNLPFLKEVAKRGKPIILSTGMCFFNEIEIVLKELANINKQIILLQCTANYPIQNHEANLNVIPKFMKEFNILVGYSDHTVGIGASPYAVSLGAKVIEKHFTLNKKLRGPDHKASLSPRELELFVKEIRKAEEYLGNDLKKPTFSEKGTRKSLQKCFVARKNIKKGEVFRENNIVAKRTGGIGISPILTNKIFGRASKRSYFKDEIIKN